MNTTKRVRLMALSPLGHTVEVKDIEELKPEELFEPGYAVLAAGCGVCCWFDLVQSCREAETEVIRLASLTHGC